MMAVVLVLEEAELVMFTMDGSAVRRPGYEGVEKVRGRLAERTRGRLMARRDEGRTLGSIFGTGLETVVQKKVHVVIVTKSKASRK